MVSLSFPLRQSSLLKYLLGINSVLIVYVLLRSIQLIYTLVEQAENPSMILIRSLSLIAAIALTYMTYKKNNIASWAMVCFLAISGVGIFLFGLFTVSMSQYVMKVFNILLGLYFFYGTIILFKSLRRNDSN